MPPRDRPGRSDPDDWFADLDEAAPASRPPATPPTPAHQHQLHRPGDTHEWLNVETGPGDPDSASGFTITLGARLAIAAVALAVVVLVVLAFSGVFSGSPRHPATATTTAQLTRPTTTTTSPSTAPATTPTRPRPAIPAPAVTLQPGDQGAQVKLLQQTLRRLGYLNTPADGIYGHSTQDALAALQRVSLLPADGVLGPQTLHALDQSVKQARRGSP